MRIGINARNLLAKKLEGFGQYTLEITKRICEQNPQHEFILFFDRPYDPQFIFSDNVKPVVISPQTRHPILYLIWFEWRLKNALKREKIDVFWSPDGFSCLSSSVPHIITIHDLNFEHNPKDLPWIVSRYFRFFFPKFASKAKKIITVSEYSKEDICTTYGIKKEKVEVIYNAANTAFRQLTEQEICDTKNDFTAGNDFFIFVGSLHPRKNIQNLIYAFELFCVSNKSIKLVIVGSDMWKENNLVISDEVRKQLIFTGHIENAQLTKLMGSALALTYIPYFEGFGIPLVEAMNCGIPIIAANTTCLPEIAQDAAIYCNPFDVNDIAEKMLLVNSNSIIREDLATKSLQRSKFFDWELAAKKVDAEIKKIVETLPN